MMLSASLYTAQKEYIFKFNDTLSTPLMDILVCTSCATLFNLPQRIFYRHYLTNRIIHIAVVELEIACMSQTAHLFNKSTSGNH